MKKEITIKYIFDGKEIRLIKYCLDYCYHRLTKHMTCGIDTLVDVEELNKIRKEIKNF